MSGAEGALAGRMIFTVGARRSGTHWLQRIVTAHPDVAGVPSETHLFSHGIAPLFERFHHGAVGSPRLGVVHAPRADLVEVARDLCDRAFTPHLDPGASFLAERTPLHVLHLDLIWEIYPDASVVHIVRDGRDCARSVLTHDWRVRGETIAEVAEEWRSSVAAGLAHRGRRRYVELRYEDLLADPRRRIVELYEALGLEASASTIDAALAEAGLHQNVDRDSSPVASGKWREVFSESDLEQFDRVAGELLAELGYSRTEPALGGQQAVAGPERPDGGRAGAALARRSRQLAARIRRLGARDGPGDWDLLRFSDELLGCVHEGWWARLAELLDPELSVEIVVAGERRLSAAGAGGRELLIETLRADPMTSARQLWGEVFPAAPEVVAVTAYELPDGSRAERVLRTRWRGRRVWRLTLFQLPIRPSSR